MSAFWDIEWAQVDDKSATDTLDRLKSWRTHLPPNEPGVKCMMMDGWQELSGASRPGEEPQSFWKALRTSGKSGIASDLRPNEMLCAIAFIKRRFARCFHEIESDMGGWFVRGWGLPHGVPSVHYLAVAPWLASVISMAQKDDKTSDALWRFHDAAYDLTGNYGEWDSNIKCIRDAIEGGAKKKWTALDGTVFFEAMLDNQNLWGEKSAEAGKLLPKLNALNNAADVAPASPFYAVLMMDGDSLGEQMSDASKQQPIADALATFTAEVETIVCSHSGFLIYAGGDDVLALLPLEHALRCATALREKYIACFSDTSVATSISAAIEYAHAKMPLGKVLHDAHSLLDDVAKDNRGRDAIACRVWKPGGMTVEWAQPWEVALNHKGHVVIEQLADDFSSEQVQDSEQSRFAGKFFYRIGERFDLLNPTKDKNGHWVASTLNEEQAISLMAMEYMNSGASTVKTMNEARTIVRPLLEQCRPVVRDSLKPKDAWTKSRCLDSGGALLLRFIAQKGVEQ